MAQRMIRDWTKSEKVNTLSANAEVLFVRLCMKADDYGSFYSEPKLIRPDLFPYKIDSIREADIARWLDELHMAGLIVFYEAESKKYLRILNFGQRMRSMKSRFPEIPSQNDNSRQPAATCGEPPPEEKRNRREIEREVEGEKKSSPPPPYTAASYSGAEILNNEDNMARCLTDEHFKLRNFQMGVTEADQVKQLTQNFIDYRNGVSKTHSNQQDFRTHYFNWLPKHLSKNNKSNDQNQTGLSEAAKRLKEAAAKARG